MKIELRYFTGTGNSWKVLHDAQNKLLEAGHDINLAKLDPDEHELHADMIGFAFPVYSFGMPHIVRKYFKSIKPFKEKQKVFLLITSGDVKGSSSTSKKCIRLLSKKNCDIIYSDVIKMPHNWITFSNASSDEEIQVIIADEEKQITKIVDHVINDVRYHHDVKQTPVVLRSLGNAVNVLFRSVGRKKLMDWYRVYDSCDGCGLCADACPTGCIEMNNGKPNWKGSCEQCMRCVIICPQEAIYQKFGDTKGKKRYFAPGFDPMEQ